MARTSSTAALMTMAKRDSKRNRGGGCGNGSGGRKGHTVKFCSLKLTSLCIRGQKKWFFPLF